MKLYSEALNQLNLLKINLANTFDNSFDMTTEFLTSLLKKEDNVDHELLASSSFYIFINMMRDMRLNYNLDDNEACHENSENIQSYDKQHEQDAPSSFKNTYD